MAINSFKFAGLYSPTPALYADFSETPTGTFADAGVNYKYITYNSSGTLTITNEGSIDCCLVAGGGGAHYIGWNRPLAAAGGGGGFIRQTFFITAGTYTITIGAGGAGASNGGTTSLGTLLKIGGGQRGYAIGVNATNSGYGGGGSAGGSTVDANGGGYLYSDGGGAGGLVFGSANRDGRTDNLTNSVNTYGVGGLGSGTSAGAANTGNGGESGSGSSRAGGSGVVIVRVRTN